MATPNQRVQAVLGHGRTRRGRRRRRRRRTGSGQLFLTLPPPPEQVRREATVLCGGCWSYVSSTFDKCPECGSGKLVGATLVDA